MKSFLICFWACCLFCSAWLIALSGSACFASATTKAVFGPVFNAGGLSFLGSISLDAELGARVFLLIWLRRFSGVTVNLLFSCDDSGVIVSS